MYLYKELLFIYHPQKMKDRVGLVRWSTAHSLPTKSSLVNHRSVTGQGKSASERL